MLAHVIGLPVDNEINQKQSVSLSGKITFLVAYKL